MGCACLCEPRGYGETSSRQGRLPWLLFGGDDGCENSCLRVA